MSKRVNRRALVEWAFDPTLFRDGQKVLVAVSGGADSMVLLELMAGLARARDLKISVLHINYGLRGRESDLDQLLVSKRCRELGVFLTIEKTDEVRRDDANLEERARELRYRLLHKVARELGAQAIVLGHTLDDQAETILMHLLRGSGLTGLGGIKARSGLLVRPLLSAGRQAVRDYAREREISYRDDASNKDLKFRRNKIREHLLPLLAREYNPRIKDSLVSSAALIREDENFMQEMVATIYRRFVKKSEAGLSISAKEFLSLPRALQRRLLRYMSGSLLPDQTPTGNREALLLALAALEKSGRGVKLDLGAGLTLQRKSGILSLALSSFRTKKIKKKTS